MGFSRQEEWSGLPFPPSGDLPDPGTEPLSPMSPARAGGFFTTASPGKLLESMLRITMNYFIYTQSKPVRWVGYFYTFHRLETGDSKVTLFADVQIKASKFK